jgi:hypothetical protein
MRKIYYIYILLLLLFIIFLYNLNFSTNNNHENFVGSTQNISVPLPIIYLPLTDYFDTKTYIDIYKNPIYINGLEKNDFDEINGVKFNGDSNKYIQTYDLSGSYTICFSVYITEITPNSYIFNQGKLYNNEWMNGLGMFLTVQNSSMMHLGIYDSILYSGSGIEGYGKLLNNWTFISIVVKPNVPTVLYINGFAYPKNGINHEWSKGSFIIGGQTLNGPPFKGYMRDFMAFGTALSQYQIYGLYSKSQSTELLQDLLVPVPIKISILNNGDVYQNGLYQLVFNPLSGYNDYDTVQTLKGYSVLNLTGNVIGIITNIRNDNSLPSNKIQNAIYINLNVPWPVPIDSIYYLKSPDIKSNPSITGNTINIGNPNNIYTEPTNDFIPGIESEIINYLTIDNYELQFFTKENINNIKLDYELLSSNLKKLGNIRFNTKIKANIKKLITLLLSLYTYSTNVESKNIIIDIYGILTNL